MPTSGCSSQASLWQPPVRWRSARASKAPVWPCTPSGSCISPPPSQYRAGSNCGGPGLASSSSGWAWRGGSAPSGWPAAAAWRATKRSQSVVVPLVLAGFAQILVRALAYIGPVLRGGGHERLSAGFALTRSWTALALVNLGGIAWVAHHRWLAATAS